MTKFLLLFLLLSSIIAASQNAPTPSMVRQSIAQSITGLNVAPEEIAVVQNDYVIAGNDSIPIRIYQPAAGKKLPVLYMVHGGAWVAGDLDTHDNICRYLANHLQVIVVAVHYRRPPEHKFPAAFNDCYAVLQWIGTNQARLNGNGTLVLLGDSAGGQLAASLCLYNASRPSPIPIKAQVLVNPGLNLSKESNSYKAYTLVVDWYLNEQDDRSDIRISPLLAASVKGVPPTWIAITEKDELREDGEAYHQKLLSGGIPSVLYMQPNIGHLAGLWCATHEKAKPTMDFVVSAMKQVLGQTR